MINEQLRLLGLNLFSAGALSVVFMSTNMWENPLRGIYYALLLFIILSIQSYTLGCAMLTFKRKESRKGENDENKNVRNA